MRPWCAPYSSTAIPPGIVLHVLVNSWAEPGSIAETAVGAQVWPPSVLISTQMFERPKSWYS
ncbi:MAG: hypothetical protein E6G02_06575 [Actinobacteria bacterium]|nr:MAG: hypothetical protein E6G02_06575 [Actinomycetota bacterium]